MLELEIQNLREEMAKLRESIEAMSAAIGQTSPERVETKTEHKAAKPEAKQEKPKPAEPESSPAQSLSRDDLQDLCMRLVREDRSRKRDIMDAIASFGDAATLKDVPDAYLPALRVMLEAIA